MPTSGGSAEIGIIKRGRKIVPFFRLNHDFSIEINSKRMYKCEICRYCPVAICKVL